MVRTLLTLSFAGLVGLAVAAPRPRANQAPPNGGNSAVPTAMAFHRTGAC